MMFFTEEELRELTGKKRRSSKTRVLNALGIVHKIRPDGSLVVLRSHVAQQLGDRAPPAKKEKEFEPNWAALEALEAEDIERGRAQRDEKREDQPEAKEEGLATPRVGAARLTARQSSIFVTNSPSVRRSFSSSYSLAGGGVGFDSLQNGDVS